MDTFKYNLNRLKKEKGLTRKKIIDLYFEYKKNNPGKKLFSIDNITPWLAPSHKTNVKFENIKDLANILGVDVTEFFKEETKQ